MFLKGSWEGCGDQTPLLKVNYFLSYYGLGIINYVSYSLFLTTVHSCTRIRETKFRHLKRLVKLSVNNPTKIFLTLSNERGFKKTREGIVNSILGSYVSFTMR